MTYLGRIYYIVDYTILSLVYSTLKLFSLGFHTFVLYVCVSICAL